MLGVVGSFGRSEGKRGRRGDGEGRGEREKYWRWKGGIVGFVGYTVFGNIGKFKIENIEKFKMGN